MLMNKNNQVKLAVIGLVILLFLTQIAATPALQLTSSAQAQTFSTKQANLNDSGTELKDWWFHYFTIIYSPYSCHAGVAGCYANPDYHVNSWLQSKSSVKIENSWANPALTFWTKHDTRHYLTFCYVEVRVNGQAQWDRLAAFTGSKDWYQKSVDLKPYSGKDIYIKFYCEPNRGVDEKLPNYYNKQILYLQDIKVIPDSTVQ